MTILNPSLDVSNYMLSWRLMLFEMHRVTLPYLSHNVLIALICWCDKASQDMVTVLLMLCHCSNLQHRDQCLWPQRSRPSCLVSHNAILISDTDCALANELFEQHTPNTCKVNLYFFLAVSYWKWIMKAFVIITHMICSIIIIWCKCYQHKSAITNST